MFYALFSYIYVYSTNMMMKKKYYTQKLEIINARFLFAFIFYLGDERFNIILALFFSFKL